ncbi:MAG: hypothetical protein ACOCWO_01530 [Candidatus Muiribacteriaceae bacterium]
MFNLILLILIIWLLAEIFKDRLTFRVPDRKDTGKGTVDETVFEKINEDGDTEYYDENGRIEDISKRTENFAGSLPKGLKDALKPILIVFGIIIFLRFLPYLIAGFFGIVLPVIFFMFIVDPDGIKKRLTSIREFIENKFKK